MISKKGIVVKFLVTIILAIIIFLPACYVGARLFRVSEQAKDNYVDFVKELNQFAQTGQGKKSLILIMDKGTGLIYFHSGKKSVNIAVDAAAGLDYTIILEKPMACNPDKNCLCLFRAADFDASITSATLKITAKRQLCTDLSYNVTTGGCGFGEPHLVNSYTCSGGFLIERNLAAESSWKVDAYYEAPRRTTLYLEKTTFNTIQLNQK